MNTMLNFIPKSFQIENNVNNKRVLKISKEKTKPKYIVYLMTRNLRVQDNFALIFAMHKAEELNIPLKFMYKKLEFETTLKTEFYNTQLEELRRNFSEISLDFETSNTLPELNKSLVIVDFDPIENHEDIINLSHSVIEVDSQNIVPTRFASQKQEYSSATFRPKIYHNLTEFLTEIPQFPISKTNAIKSLENFIESKLQNYATDRNDPTKDGTSNLSKFLNLGFLSAQRVALEVVKSSATRESKESFLEELIVRRELSNNFCFYNNEFKSLKSAPNWALQTLENHQNDYRQYLYSQAEFEFSKTHEPLWNAAQNELRTTGKIHGYLRMYWAKKILEWCKTPEDAIQTAIYLNDKYALDAPSPNGYVGILWSIAGLHDKGFMEREVIGKIRPMTYNGVKSKFKIEKYIEKYS